MARARKKQQKNHANNRLHKKVDASVPFMAHIHELRRRLFYIAISVIGISVAAYGVQQHIVAALLQPAHGQHFIYTTPIGGIDFLLRVCLYTGIALSVPVIVYQILRYFEPLFKDNATSHFVAVGTVASGVLAIMGMAIGYFLGLPAVFHFLTNQFTSEQIQALVTINSYMSFVIVYLLGSALLLQMPLILLFINRIKPLKPRALFKKERWVILGAFVLGGIMDPSPTVISQVILAIPIIVTYQIGILLVWYTNRRSRHSPKVTALLTQDLEAREARLAALANAKLAFVPRPAPAAVQSKAISATPTMADTSRLQPTRPQPAVRRTPAQRSVPRRLYTDDVRPRNQLEQIPAQNA